MTDQPARDGSRHRSKILPAGKLVVRFRQEVKPFGAAKRLQQALALVERDQFVACALDDERRCHNP
jgi:hypothetical protein